MMEASTEHTTFAIERRFAAPPDRVFAAWASEDAKRRWAVCHMDGFEVRYSLDFRVGGTEVNRADGADGPAHLYEAWFLDIVPGRRIIYAFNMAFRGKPLSSSLATVTFTSAGTGTLMRFTEQVAVLDGHDVKPRIAGTGEGFDRLADFLAEAA
jgi:uncharacterized protein YndB with AHSA1/START domain